MQPRTHHSSKRRPTPHSNAQHRACEIPGCTNPGEYRAPKSPMDLSAHYWFCLDHVRAFNKQWDYFSGMNTEQIEAFMKDAVTGHRPTWKREEVAAFTTAHLRELLDRFLRQNSPSPQMRKRQTKEQKALAVLDLDQPYTQAELKARYKQLVKQCHPDLHPNNKLAEERFKMITSAYHFLQKSRNITPKPSSH